MTEGRGATSRSMRLFVAIDAPAEVERVVEAAVAAIRDAYPGARWVPRSNRHATMKFLGSSSPDLLPWVRERVGSVAGTWAPVPSALTSLGSFPTRTRTRVLWAGLDDATGGLAALARALDEELAPRFPVETRPFTAHLTVARSDPPLRLDPSLFAARLDAPAFAIEHLVLYRSHLGRPAPRYEALEMFPLAG